MIQKLLWIAGAGATGTLCRYGLGLAAQRLIPGEFPLSTVLINILGCFGFGFIWAFVEEKMFSLTEVRSIVLIGFFGAFTTFSTYAFETAQLIRDGQWLAAAGNMALQNVLGIAFLFLGLFLGAKV